MDPHKFDKRVIRRNLNRGVVALEDYKEYLNRLPDLEEKCEAIEVPLKKDSGGNEEGDEAESTPDNDE